MNRPDGYKCPKCTAVSLTVDLSLALGPDDYSDETAIQVLGCKACSFEGAGWYDASRRGSDDRFHHLVYDTLVTPMVKSTIEQCPTPKISTCRCFGHTLMRKCVKDPAWLSVTVPTRVERD